MCTSLGRAGASGSGTSQGSVDPATGSSLDLPPHEAQHLRGLHRSLGGRRRRTSIQAKAGVDIETWARALAAVARSRGPGTRLAAGSQTPGADRPRWSGPLFGSGARALRTTPCGRPGPVRCRATRFAIGLGPRGCARPTGGAAAISGTPCGSGPVALAAGRAVCGRASERVGLSRRASGAGGVMGAMRLGTPVGVQGTGGRIAFRDGTGSSTAPQAGRRVRIRGWVKQRS